MSFAPIQKQVDDYIAQFKEGYFPPLEMLARLTEELGELARALSHHAGFKKPKSGETPGDVAEGCCDLLLVGLSLANERNTDLDAAFAATRKKYYLRRANRW